MKANFLVSAHPKARLPGARELFVTDPYVRHALEMTGELGQYERVIVAPPSRATREEFQRDHDFVDARYHRYVPILAERLNEAHGTQHPVSFWQKALSLSLLRHVTFCYDLFQACEAHLRPQEHDCRILAEDSFFVPDDFNAHRRFLEHSDYGQEQLFSVYSRLFHPGLFPEWSDTHVVSPKARGKPAPGPSWAKRLHPKRALRRLLRLRAPTVGIINSYFSAANVERLLFTSGGRIQPIALPEFRFRNEPPDWRMRGTLSRAEPSFDRFDRFVFAALRHGMPRAFVEEAPRVISELQRLFSRYPKLRWVVSEAWIGDMATAFALAILKERGVRHIYNEHNYLAYPFLGNNLKYLIPLVDEYATLGWHDARAPHLTRGASLFAWKASPRAPRTIPLLIVGSIATAHPPEVNASYGEAGTFNAQSYYRFMNDFLGHLPDDVLRAAVYRGYPKTFTDRALHYGDTQLLAAHIGRLHYDNDPQTSAKALMGKARLVVVSYLSTAYLEALISDIPTVILWNRQTYLLEQAHPGVFADLLAAEVFQDDPVRAAQFVSRIAAAPERWWQTARVREARARFLAQNLGEPSRMLDILNARAKPFTKSNAEKLGTSEILRRAKP